MIGCNLKNSALDHEILFQMEMPFILLGMELSLSKRVYIVSYVLSGHCCLSSPGEMPGVGFCSYFAVLPQPRSPVTKSKNLGFIGRSREINAINADFCVHVYSSRLRIRNFHVSQRCLSTTDWALWRHNSCFLLMECLPHLLRYWTIQLWLPHKSGHPENANDSLYLSMLWKCFLLSGQRSGIRPVTTIPFPLCPTRTPRRIPRIPEVKAPACKGSHHSWRKRCNTSMTWVSSPLLNPSNTRKQHESCHKDSFH